MLDTLSQLVRRLTDRFCDGIVDEKQFDDAMREFDRLEMAIELTKERLRAVSLIGAQGARKDAGKHDGHRCLGRAEEKLFRLGWELRESFSEAISAQAGRYLDEIKNERAYRALRIYWCCRPGASVVLPRVNASR